MVVCIPGGENRSELRARAVEAVQEIAAAHPGEHVVIVLHGGPISEVLRHYGLWRWIVGDLDAPPIGNTSRSRAAPGRLTARRPNCSRCRT